MDKIKSDIEIARSAKIKPIKEVLESIGVRDEKNAFSPIGHHIAKLNLEYIDQLKEKKSNLVLVTAITPTPAGEGKTTTSIGLCDGLNKIGKKAIVCLREPSLGPSFGMKGGAAGGGYAQVLPMEQINLHFTGDFHAITTAHNLLSALIDNHVYWGNDLNIDVRRVVWRRVIDLNDRALRSININLGGVVNGFPRESTVTVDIGGVRTNFRMPDILALGLGGGSLVKLNSNIKIGPESVGFRIKDAARTFGGDILTATDIAVAAGHADIGDRSRLLDLSPTFIDESLGVIHQMLENLVDRMKTSSNEVPLILVGGGSILVNRDIAGVSEIIVPDHAGVANAIGASITQVGGEIDKVYSYEEVGRETAIDCAKKEAIKNAISQIKHDEVKPKIILSDIGMVTETDVSLTKASNAVLIAFNVKPSKEAKILAEQEKITIHSYNIIYEVLDFIKNKMSGLLTPDVQEKIIGSAEILEIFKVSKVGKVAGSKVIEGEILQDSNARVIRDGTIIFNGKIGSIYREKNQAKQVSAGLECGITIKDFIDFKEKDIIEVYNSTVTERSI